MEENKDFSLIFYVGIAVIALTFFVYRDFETKEIVRSGEKIYTVGIITSQKEGSGIIPWFTFRFKTNQGYWKSGKTTIDDKEQMNLSQDQLKKDYIGKKFVAYYFKEDVDINDILYKSRLIDTVSIPQVGWREIPIQLIIK